MFTKFSVTGSSLALLKAGQKGIIKFCNTQNKTIQKDLTAIGITPGAVITVVQRFPFFIIKVEHKYLRISRRVARIIYVRILKL